LLAVFSFSFSNSSIASFTLFAANQEIVLSYQTSIAIWSSVVDLTARTHTVA
jgi:hypothetical protein